MKFGGAWLLAMIEPLLGKILATLGFSVISITGLTVITTTMKDQAKQGLSLLSPDMLQVFLLAGGAQGLGIIIGALTTKLLLVQLQGSMKFIGANPST